MAFTVPVYNESQVQTVGIEAPRAQAPSAATFGAGLGAGLQHLGNAALDIESEIKKQDDQTKAYDFRVALDQHENAAKFGDPGENVEGQEPTAMEGFLKIEGAEAMQFRDAYIDDFRKKALDSIPKDVTPNVRATLERMAQERVNNLTGEFSRHALAQEKVANQAATGAMEKSILNNISNNAFDENRFQIELGILKHVVDDDVTKNYGENNEAANAIRKSRIELAVNDAYSQRINRMLLDNPSQAKQFLTDNANNGTFLPATVDHYTQVLKPLTANAEGIDKAYEMVPRLKAGEDIDKLIAEGQAGFKSRPDAFKVFEAQMRAAEGDILKARVQAAKNAAMPVQKLIIDAEKGGGKMDPATLLNSTEYKTLVALGTPEALELASAYSDKTFSEHHAVVAEARAVESEKRRERGEARREAKLDALGAKSAQKEAQQLEFTNLSLSPDKVASMDDFETAQKVIELGPHYGEQFRKLKASLTSPEKLAQVKLDSKVFNSLMGQLGVTDKKKQAAYYASALDYLAAQQMEGKRVFRPDQMRTAVIGAFQDVKVNERVSPLGIDSLSYTSTSTKKLIDVQNQDAIVIPPEDTKTITDFLKSGGIADTPRNRLRVYKRILSDRGSANIKQAR